MRFGVDARDTYAPSVALDGSVLFKTQIFTAQLATSPAAGGAVTVLTDFQSETPTFDPTGKQIAMTYGTWRRVVDDATYPDIAQELGIIPCDNDAPPASQPVTFHASQHLAFTIWTCDAQFWRIRP